ncbi:MAG: hypothetical protein P8M34_11800 [Saprospiraceae bacterium]|nr:hypothetical protein [Saprospiraceae bacterium]
MKTPHMSKYAPPLIWIYISCLFNRLSQKNITYPLLKKYLLAHIRVTGQSLGFGYGN